MILNLDIIKYYYFLRIISLNIILLNLSYFFTILICLKYPFKRLYFLN